MAVRGILGERRKCGWGSGGPGTSGVHSGAPAEGSSGTEVAPSAVTHKLFHGAGEAWPCGGGGLAQDSDLDGALFF